MWKEEKRDNLKLLGETRRNNVVELNTQTVGRHSLAFLYRFRSRRFRLLIWTTRCESGNVY